MDDKTTQTDLDPLYDSPEKLRVKQAQLRLGAAGESGVPIPKPEAEKQRRTHFEGSYQNSLFSSAGSLGRPAWSDSMGGRAVIRLISRGIVGAAFFTLAARHARVQLADYNPQKIDRSKPLQWIAKTFDVTFGKAISGTTRGVSRLAGLSEAQVERNAWNAVNFRTKIYTHSKDGLLGAAGSPKNGRSLGAEMTAISFDFAMMSIGDAMTRNFIQMLDPNIKKTWWLNDQGEIAGVGDNRHFSASKWIQSTGRAAWRILSKNQGEDWAVSLPYVYQMRLQRHVMTRLMEHDLKGSKLFFDNALNGAAYKVNNAGQIIGDYNLAGAADLHARFVGYNVYTLMFREGYDTVANKLKQWKESGYQVTPHLPAHPLQSLGHGLNNTVRYVIKSTIKANMYMNPAVIPFWLMRVPSSKWRGSLINAEIGKGENAIASHISFDERVARRSAEMNVPEAEMRKRMVVDKDGATILNYNTNRDKITPYEIGKPQPDHMWFGNQKVTNPMKGLNTPYDSNAYAHYEPGVSSSFSKALNPIGKFSYWLGGKATRLAEALPESGLKRLIGMNEANPLLHDAAGRERFMRTMVDASLAYTPYFYTKTELGLRVDDTPSTGGRGKMDTAIYGLMDNLAALKFRSAGRSIKEMWHLSTHVNHDPILREGEVIKDEPVKKMSDMPQTTIQAEGRIHQVPVELSREEKAALPKAQEQDRQWSQMITQNGLSDKLIAPTTHTRH